MIPPMEEILLTCWLGPDEVPCKDLFFARLGVWNMGLCYTFNFNGTITRGPGTFAFTYSNYTLRWVTADGLPFDSDSMPVRKDFCFSPQAPFQGFKVVAVHSVVNVLPSNIGSFGILVSPGYRTQISAKEVVVDKQKVENLGKCSSATELDLYGDLPYTQANCVDECIARLIWKECRCTWFSLPFSIDEAAQFLYKNVYPWEPEERNVTVEVFRNTSSVCYGSSAGVSCMTRTAATRFPPTNMLPALMAQTNITSKKEFTANIGELDIQLSTMQTTLIEEDWALTTFDLFNDLGGSLGLFLGISVFTAVELTLMVIALTCGCTPDKK